MKQKTDIMHLTRSLRYVIENDTAFAGFAPSSFVCLQEPAEAKYPAAQMTQGELTELIRSFLPVDRVEPEVCFVILNDVMPLSDSVPCTYKVVLEFQITKDGVFRMLARSIGMSFMPDTFGINGEVGVRLCNKWNRERKLGKVTYSYREGFSIVSEVANPAGVSRGYLKSFIEREMRSCWNFFLKVWVNFSIDWMSVEKDDAHLTSLAEMVMGWKPPESQMTQSELDGFLRSFLPIRRSTRGSSMMLLNDMIQMEYMDLIAYKVAVAFRMEEDVFLMLACSDMKLQDSLDDFRVRDAAKGSEVCNEWNLERDFDKVMFEKPCGFVIATGVANPAEVSREYLKSLILDRLNSYWTFFIEVGASYGVQWFKEGVRDEA